MVLPPFIYNFSVSESTVTENPDPPIDAINYYTDGSKMDSGFGSSFCIVEQNLCECHTPKGGPSRPVHP